jgi:predicted membrane chloride channel (bestrophin family)
MIVKEKVAWLRLLFYFRGTSFEKTWPRILVVTVVSIIVTYVELYYNIQNYTLTMRCHLRHEDPAADIEKFLPQQDFTAVMASTHRPLVILQ